MFALRKPLSLVAAFALLAALQAVEVARPETAAADTEPLIIRFDWSMPARYGDFDGNGLMDQFTDRWKCNYGVCKKKAPTNPNPIIPDTWTVELDACETVFSNLGATDFSFSWELLSSDQDLLPGAVQFSGGPACGSYQMTVPAEGTYRVQLTVEATRFNVPVSDQIPGDIVVQDWLIVSLGDSYGSGEGNPDENTNWDNVSTLSQPWMVQQMAARWQDDRCHRSDLAASALAARVLEEADPKTSVTFIHLACSGALVLEGLLGPYMGRAGYPEKGEFTRNGVNLPDWQGDIGGGCVPEGSSLSLPGSPSEARDEKYPPCDPLPPQLDEVSRLVGDREIDALYVSIGGNDAFFGNIVESCMDQEVCDPVYASRPERKWGQLKKALQRDLLSNCWDWGTRQPAKEAWCELIDYLTPKLLWAKLNGAGNINWAEYMPPSAETWFDRGIAGYRSPYLGIATLYDMLATGLSAWQLSPEVKPPLLSGPEVDRVYLTEYPDAVTYWDRPGTWGDGDVVKEYCSKKVTAGIVNQPKKSIPGITRVESMWVHEEVEPVLNAEIAKAARRHGWNLVGGLYEIFIGHGVCADADTGSQRAINNGTGSWLRGFLNAFEREGRVSGAAHPNPRGHQIIRNRILKAWMRDLYPHSQWPGLLSPMIPDCTGDGFAHHPVACSPWMDGGPITHGEILAIASDWASTFAARPPQASESPDPPTATCHGLAATHVGTDGDDAIAGTEGPDVIAALGGNDVVYGLGGDDVICGGWGNDRIEPGPGDDTVRGGDGRDTIEYRSAPSGVLVNLAAGKASGGHGNDTFDLFEYVVGSEYDDALKGSARINRITGLGGNDTLVGFRGNDVLDGGDGDDTILYTRAKGGVTVDLAAGTASGADGEDAISSIEVVIGSVFRDILEGSALADRLLGRDGNDLLVGRGGNDRLIGEAGVDKAVGGGGRDTCRAETVVTCER